MKETFMGLQPGQKVWALIYGQFPEETTIVSVGPKQAKIAGSRTVKAGDTTVLFKSKVEMFQRIVDNKIAARECAEARLMEAQRAVDQARDKMAEAKQEQA